MKITIKGKKTTIKIDRDDIPALALALTDIVKQQEAIIKMQPPKMHKTDINAMVFDKITQSLQEAWETAKARQQP